MKCYATVPVHHSTVREKYPEDAFDDLFDALHEQGRQDIFIGGDIPKGVSKVSFGFETGADSYEAATKEAAGIVTALIQGLGQSETMIVVADEVEIAEVNTLDDREGPASS